MTDKKITDKAWAILHKAQRDEATDALIYGHIAAHEKHPENAKLLASMAKDEQDHYAVWFSYTKQSVSANKASVLWHKIIYRILGFTFVLKKMSKAEALTQAQYQTLREEIPEAAAIIEQEHQHEQELLGLLDEERLKYVGAMVLGLNDALVELTGAIVGVTFALMNTHMIALTGIITGVSATLSMASSNYLAERTNGNSKALKSSLYTGIAYLVTVILMVLPYLLFPTHMYVAAFVCMLAIVVVIIVAFNYYLSVAKGVPFWRRFGEMFVISSAVALIAFVIAHIAKNLLGLNVG